MRGEEGERTSGWLKLFSAGYYCLASMTVHFANKSLFTSYHFDFPLTVTLLQMMVIMPIAYLVARPKLEWSVAKVFIPLSIVNVLNVVCGLMGTAGLNVPMFIALRRFALLCTIILERLMLHKAHDNPTIGSIAVMIGGALIAASTDLSFNLYGYLAVTLNNFLTALYLVMVKKVPGYQGLTSTGILFYTAGLSIPMLVAALLLTREPWHLKYYPNFFSHGFRVSLISSCALSLSINHSTFVCTRYNDPLTTSVAGNLKNIVMTGVGIYAFGDFVYHKINAMGIGISMAGAIWYATWSAMRARKKSYQQQSLMTKSSDKKPIIGKDRLAILNRAQGITGSGTSNGYTRTSSAEPKNRSSPMPHSHTDPNAASKDEPQRQQSGVEMV